PKLFSRLKNKCTGHISGLELHTFLVRLTFSLEDSLRESNSFMRFPFSGTVCHTASVKYLRILSFTKGTSIHINVHFALFESKLTLLSRANTRATTASNHERAVLQTAKHEAILMLPEGFYYNLSCCIRKLTDALSKSDFSYFKQELINNYHPTDFVERALHPPNPNTVERSCIEPTDTLRTRYRQRKLESICCVLFSFITRTTFQMDSRLPRQLVYSKDQLKPGDRINCIQKVDHQQAFEGSNRRTQTILLNHSDKREQAEQTGALTEDHRIDSDNLHFDGIFLSHLSGSRKL
ncbi:hypothetical protein X801_02478, partial [Opisthorchis viverrini]